MTLKLMPKYLTTFQDINKRIEMQYTVEEVSRRFNVSGTFIRQKLIKKGYKKELIEQRYRYMISEKMVNEIFNIPDFNPLDIEIPKNNLCKYDLGNTT